MAEFKFNIPGDYTAAKAADVRNNFEALATTNITEDPSLPKNPKCGMLRILASDPANLLLQVFVGSWRTIFANVGSSTVSVTRKEQIFPLSTEWVFDHNLNIQPLVQVLDSFDNIIVPENMQHTSSNRVVIRHTTAQSGKVIVIG